MGSAFPAAGDIAALVRLPAVLSVPGDVLVGAALAGRAVGPRTLVLTAASGCLYLAGMALNDWADRAVDARERPGRPIPAGRVSPTFALGLSAALTGGGLALAAVAGRGSALGVALPLAGTVWAYDLAVKGTAAGPVGMAACRSLDVLLGAGLGGSGAGHRFTPLRAALPGAAVVGAHTLAVTGLSRREVGGGAPDAARHALWATAAVTAGAAVVAARRAPLRGRPGRVALAASLLGAYAATLGRAQQKAVRDPSPVSFQRAVGTGVLGLMPLEAGLLAAAGPLPAAVAVAAAWPVARSLARWRAVT
jgi:hypothetical protein